MNKRYISKRKNVSDSFSSGQSKIVCKNIEFLAIVNARIFDSEQLAIKGLTFSSFSGFRFRIETLRVIVRLVDES